jgi:tetratricopeptide (TPR) repeat protein
MRVPVRLKAYLIDSRSVRSGLTLAAALSLLTGCESFNQTLATLNATPSGLAAASDASATADASSASEQMGAPGVLAAHEAPHAPEAVQRSALPDPAPDTTASIAAPEPPLPPPAPPPEAQAVIPDPYDDLNLGKRHFREGNFGLAERYFRHAVEKAPGDADRDAEAWLGLAATYDRLRRFELADRGYAQVLKILGPTAEVLNNQGYSYLLRGDYRRARIKLAAARNLDPANPYVQNNLDLLYRSARGKGAP